MTIVEANHPIATALRSLISKRGVKQVFVAQKAGYTSQELNDMLNGRKLIRACDIPRLAEALDVRVDELYKEGGE